MSVGLLIVAHRHIGTEILVTASRTVGICPLQTRSLEVFDESALDTLIERAQEMLGEVDAGSGVLLLTDAYGSTPANIALAAGQGRRCCVVTGLNLPMLLRVFNYASHNLTDLASTAVAGGHAGIIEVGDGGGAL